MKIAITGATGFIGQYVVKEALSQGHQVLALLRKNAAQTWEEEPNIEVVCCDLLKPAQLHKAIANCDVIIHLAAVMVGEQQYTQSLSMTRNLLKAMDTAGVDRLIALSSISILDYVREQPMNMIDESTPLNQNDVELGAYALMKRDQEKLYRQWSDKGEKSVHILRPGLVYDKQHLSSAHVGFIKKSHGLLAQHSGYVPVVHIESVAQAVIAVAINPPDTKIIHLTNNDLPTQAVYTQVLKQHKELGIVIPLPWRAYSAMSASIRKVLLTAGMRQKIPDSFNKNSVAARQKPFNFNNDKAKNCLNWQPRSSMDI